MAESLDDDDVPFEALPPKPQPRARAPRNQQEPSAPLGRTPPHSIEAEEFLLSGMLLDGDESIESVKSRHLPTAAFYSLPNQIIFNCILEIHTRRGRCDVAVLAEELKTQKLLDQVGGFAYLAQISGRIPTSAQVPYFIDKIEELWRLRELIRVATGAVESVFEYQGDLPELMESVRSRIEVIAENRRETDTLVARAYNPDLKLEKPKPIYEIADTTVSTPGNLTSLYAQVKVGKSATIGAMMAAAMTNPTSGRDTLGITGPNYAKHALIHIDTELSPYDRQLLIDTTLRRAGIARPPEWFQSFSLTGLPAGECRQLIGRAIKLARKRFGGIHSIIIDGVGDLVVDPNDPEESFPVITWLHGLAIQYSTAIVNVLHQNPGADQKGRGHLGSQLERKSESNITLEKSGDVTRLYATKQRGKMITKENGPTFQWSDEQMMHVSCKAAPPSETKGLGRHRRYVLEDFLIIFPQEVARSQGFRVLHRLAREIKPTIGTGAFDQMLEDAVRDGFVLRDISNPRQPKYYKAAGPQPK